jgi:hypothetical protein
VAGLAEGVKGRLQDIRHQVRKHVPFLDLLFWKVGVLSSKKKEL